jgi:hypothetical protein
MLEVPMRKRGRVSAAAIGVTPVGISAKERPAPPSRLTARERRQWNEITCALRPDWFEAENLPLLAEYVRTAELCTRLAREVRNVEVGDPRFAGLSRQRMMATNMLVRLATKLRLTIQSSTTTRAGKHSGRSGLPKPGTCAEGANSPMVSRSAGIDRECRATSQLRPS